MAGSTIGRILQLTTWGESHGPALGAVLDGFPAGMEISEEMIQVYLDRRRPGQSAITTARREADRVQILSGVFEGRTTGTPISMIIHNGDQRSKDYGDLKDCFRPGHADYTFFRKYGLRDYRGAGLQGRRTVFRQGDGSQSGRRRHRGRISVTDGDSGAGLYPGDRPGGDQRGAF